MIIIHLVVVPNSLVVIVLSHLELSVKLHPQAMIFLEDLVSELCDVTYISLKILSNNTLLIHFCQNKMTMHASFPVA